MPRNLRHTLLQKKSQADKALEKAANIYLALAEEYNKTHPDIGESFFTIMQAVGTIIQVSRDLRKAL